MTAADFHDPAENRRFRRLRIGGDYAATYSGMLGGNGAAQTANTGGRFTLGGAVGGAGSGREFPGPSQLQVYGLDWLSYVTLADLRSAYVDQPGGANEPDVWTEDVPPGALEPGEVGFTDGGGYPVGRIRLERDSILTPATAPHDSFTFLAECLAHEFGHIMLTILFAEYGEAAIIAAICAAFGRPIGEWDSGGHDARVKEATCETYKDVLQGLRFSRTNYYDEAGRQFDNRTKLRLPFSGWEPWKDVYYGLLAPPKRDNFPWLWRTALASTPPNFGNDEIVDLGGGPESFDGFDPNEGGGAPLPDGVTGPDPERVIYHGYVAVCDIGIPGVKWVDPLVRVTYEDVTDLDAASTSSDSDAAAIAAEITRTRRLVYHPDGAITMNVDWAKPPPVSAVGVPDWSSWRLAGKMLKAVLTGGGTSVRAACVALWQQTFEDNPVINASGDELVSTPAGSWTTVLDESFQLPDWSESPTFNHTFTPPAFAANATGVRLRIMLGYHYWDGGPVECWDPTMNPLGSVPAGGGWTSPTEDYVPRGLSLPHAWVWYANSRYGGYWEVAGETGGPFQAHLLPVEWFSPPPGMRYFWSQYRPFPTRFSEDGGFGVPTNPRTTGLPWGDGMDFTAHIFGPPGPPPPAGRSAVWPYRPGAAEVPGKVSAGDEIAGRVGLRRRVVIGG